jgi:hypothetical protein
MVKEAQLIRSNIVRDVLLSMHSLLQATKIESSQILVLMVGPTISNHQSYFHLKITDISQTLYCVQVKNLNAANMHCKLSIRYNCTSLRRDRKTTTNERDNDLINRLVWSLLIIERYSITPSVPKGSHFTYFGYSNSE